MQSPTKLSAAPVALAALLAFPALLVGCRANSGEDPREPVTKATAAPSAAPIAPAASALTHRALAELCDSPSTIAIPAREPPATTTLVMLHGYGANAADIAPVARALGAASPKVAVLVPDGCEPSGGSPTGRQWWQLRGVPESERPAAIAKAGARVLAFVKKEIENEGFPGDRIVWAGFSQGAMLAQWMAVNATPPPVAVLSFSGRFDSDGAAMGPRAPRFTPVLLVHGTSDVVVPFAESEKAQAALSALGAKVERVDRPGMGHSIDAEARAAAIEFLKRNLR